MLAEQRAAHRRALDVPARPAGAVGAGPLGIVGLVGLGRLPQHEVQRVVLAVEHGHALAGAQLVERLARQLAVARELAHREVDVAVVGAVGQALALRACRSGRASAARSRWRAARAWAAAMPSAPMSRRMAAIISSVSARMRDAALQRALDDLVLDVGDVAHVGHLVAQLAAASGRPRRRPSSCAHGPCGTGRRWSCRRRTCAPGPARWARRLRGDGSACCGCAGSWMMERARRVGLGQGACCAAWRGAEAATASGVATIDFSIAAAPQQPLVEPPAAPPLPLRASPCPSDVDPFPVDRPGAGGGLPGCAAAACRRRAGHREALPRRRCAAGAAQGRRGHRAAAAATRRSRFLKGVMLSDLKRNARGDRGLHRADAGLPRTARPVQQPGRAVCRATASCRLRCVALQTALRNDPAHRAARENLGDVHLALAVQAWTAAAGRAPRATMQACSASCSWRARSRPCRRSAAADAPGPLASPTPINTEQRMSGIIDCAGCCRRLSALLLALAPRPGLAQKVRLDHQRWATSSSSSTPTRRPSRWPTSSQYVQGRPLRRHHLPPRDRQLHDPGRRLRRRT